jgi:site-specific recombinase XerD
MMMTQTLRDPHRRAPQGSLLATVQLFVEQMQAQGYAAASVKQSTRLVKDFAAWLDQHEIEGQSMLAKHVAEYLKDR